jgi:hypothetical protein
MVTLSLVSSGERSNVCRTAAGAEGAQAKTHRLMAFDKSEDDELLPAFEAREMPDERRAIQTAKELAHRHDGVIAWARDANPALGEFGVSEEQFRSNDIPDLD